MTGPLLVACSVDLSDDGCVTLDTIPNLFNGGLWLGFAALLLVFIAFRSRAARTRQFHCEMSRDR